MERISNNFLPLLAKARGGNQEAQRALVGLMAQSKEPELYLSQMQASDEEWLARAAQTDHVCPTKENFAAMGLLILAKTTRYRVWQEDFIDEDTGKPASVMRCELVDGTFFKEDARQTQELVDTLLAWRHAMDDEELWTAIDLMRRANAPLDYTPLLHTKAENDAVVRENRLAHGQSVDEDNGQAARELADMYRYGAEELGIFKDKAKAIEYYEMAGANDEDPTEDEEEEDASVETTYELRAEAVQLDAVAQLIDELTRRYGGHSDFGLFIPLGVAMQVMVGSHEYRGNILSMERPSPDRLLLRAAANSPYPLLYALRQCFPYTKTTMLETD